ncbi:hypothetical protein ACFXAQ_11200, partial [Streptomyces olivaceus]
WASLQAGGGGPRGGGGGGAGARPPPPPAAGYVRLHAAARSGDWAAARAEQDRLAALFALTDAGDPALMGGSSSALGAFKAAAHLLGLIDCPATAAPQVPLDERAVARVRDRLTEAGLL